MGMGLLSDVPELHERVVVPEDHSGRSGQEQL